MFVMVRSASGKQSRMPVDELPDPGGNVAVAPGHRARIVPKGGAVADNEVVHMPHFATCPNYKKAAAEPKPATPRPPAPASLFDTTTEE